MNEYHGQQVFRREVGKQTQEWDYIAQEWIDIPDTVAVKIWTYVKVVGIFAVAILFFMASCAKADRAQCVGQGHTWNDYSQRCDS